MRCQRLGVVKRGQPSGSPAAAQRQPQRQPQRPALQKAFDRFAEPVSLRLHGGGGHRLPATSPSRPLKRAVRSSFVGNVPSASYGAFRSASIALEMSRDAMRQVKSCWRSTRVGY